MPQKEKAHLSGGPILNIVLADNSVLNTELLRFQASLIVQRDDGKWALGWHDDAPGPFDNRADATCIANGHPRLPAPVAKFRRIKIRDGCSHVVSQSVLETT